MNTVTNKVTAEHLQRKAYLYVRQSTLHQVNENTESTRRQYDLRRRAVALGWLEEDVIVIDSDLGQSGASAQDRAGFQRLVAEVGMNNAGIVMGLEVSRLARNSSDWHRLLEICALTQTLILDEDGIYDPAHFNDRLLLGLKGTMSEAELHVLHARLRGGYLAKARRGDLRIGLPVGFVYDAADKVQLDPDRQVQDAVRLLFATFRRTASAGATVRSFHEQGLRFVCRPPHGPRMGELVWSPLSYSRALKVLHNPRYAGVYAFGRTRQRKLAGGSRATRRVTCDDWMVLHLDAHDGFISWDEFEENQRRLRANNRWAQTKRGTTPPREGPALLQGIALCGICGKRMNVRYYQRQGCRVPCYYCPRTSPALRLSADKCQEIQGTTLDEAVSKLVVEAVSPMALEVALSVHDELEARFVEADRLRGEQVEHARYEADSARRRYMRVDPDNRLVADSLEADWNVKLRELTQVQEDCERRRRAGRSVLDGHQRDRIESLASDFPTVWRAPATTDRDRKRMLRLLVEDITLVKGEQAVALHVRFRGGGTKSLSLPRPMPSWKTWLTPAETISEIDRLLDQHTNGEIAQMLNDRDFRSGQGHRFHGKIIANVRRSHGLRRRYDRLRERGYVSAGELAKSVGVSRQTVERWRRAGQVQGHAYNDKGQCLYDPATEIPAGTARWPRVQSLRCTDDGNQRTKPARRNNMNTGFISWG
jgi:DNA invertase Pin-like site-specific DNA recombinase